MNQNILVSQIFINGLVHAGLTDVVICPGSRSTPLTLVFEAHEEVQTHLCLDERSGAFLALGLAMKSGRAVAIVCTSGTAAANFYPAIIEANMSQVPLIVMTADRPPELRHSGANQTIDQVKMYGDHVLWAVDMALPEQNMPDVALRNVMTTAGRAYATATGCRKGAVHVNFPFRKPLEPSAGDQLSINSDQLVGSTNHWSPIIGHLNSLQENQLGQWFSRYERGIIVCGPNCPEGEFAATVGAFALQSGYPLFADPLSGVRFGTEKSALIVGGYESGLAGGRKPEWDAPEIVIRFGAVPTSKWLNEYLNSIDPAVRLHVRSNGVWADDSHLTSDFWQIDEVAFCVTAGNIARNFSWERRKVPPGLAWQRSVMEWEQAVQRQLSKGLQAADFDAGYLFDFLESETLPECNLVIGNSLPVRHLDAFGRPSAKKIHVFGNRGASGIDGVVSTACGIALADPDTPTFLIIGDVSFYHDMNGLLMARELPNLTIILFNNNSGSIFRRLPVSKFGEPFEKLFLTAHDLDFSHTAQLYSLEHERFTDRSAFAAGVQRALQNDKPYLLEIITDGAADEEARRALVASLD
ncbi:MAG: 2-succinyl-5-enolpyruvyl-6-hydroxy-3-cyclohexene-1-carboxylic-acid synthase [Anaerolineae bacterium]